MSLKILKKSLPDGYTELEYIESSGTQYIDTGIVVNLANSYKVTSNVLFSTSARRIICGSFERGIESGVSTAALNLEVMDSRAIRSYVIKHNATASQYLSINTSAKSLNTKILTELIWNSSTKVLSVSADGVTTTGTYSAATDADGIQFRLFLDHRADPSAIDNGLTMYDCKIEKDGMLVRNFIPAKNSSNVIGMYDLVTKQFFTNSGSGNFIAGPEATTPTKALKDTHEHYINNNGVYKYIEELYKHDGQGGYTKVFDAGWDTTVSGQAPLSLPNARAKNTSWEIDGKSKQGRLPDGYTELEYIQSSGTQWIDTGINPSGKKIGAIVDFQFTSTSPKTGGVFGSNKTDGTDNLQFTVYTSKWRIKINSYAAYGTTYNTSRHTARLNMPDGTSLDSTVYTSTQYTIASSNNLNCFIGACNYGSGSTEDYTLVGKLYSAKVYDDTTLVRNFIPAKNSSNVVGMYDLISKQFFTNAGTGDFSAGPELPSPSNPLEIKAVGDSGLPSGYKKLEYIESSGTQYIDTGVNGTNKTAVWNATVENLSSASNTAFISSGYASTVRNCYGIFIYNDVWSTYGTGEVTATGKQNIVSTTIINTSDTTSTTIVVDGVQSSTGTRDYDASHNMNNTTLFASKENASTVTSVGNFKLYSASCSLDDVLVRNFIPAQRISDSEIGMYDTVTSTFFTNAGTGDFIAGPEDTSCVVPVKVSDGTTETTYNINLDAPLQKISTYTDSIESDGTLTRALGVKVFTGTEADELFSVTGGGNRCAYTGFTDFAILENGDMTGCCSHFKNVGYSSTASTFGSREYNFGKGSTQYFTRFSLVDTGITTVAEFKSWLAAQYSSGTPVIVYYPLATATETSVAVPTIATAKGNNTFDIDTEIKPSNITVTYRKRNK